MNEALALAQRLVSLDPANPRLLLEWAFVLILMRQPLEAVHAVDRYLAQLPENSRVFWFGLRGFVEYSYTGDIRKLVLPDLNNIPAGQDPGVARANFLRNLRFMHRYADIEKTLKSEPGPLLAGGTLVELSGLGLPAPPVASARGWTRLLQGDKAGARADGQEILKLLAEIPAAVPAELMWLIRVRQSEGYLFAADTEKAVEAVRAGLALVPPSPYALQRAYAAATGAGVLAWAGHRDEAAALLEELSVAIPGLSPASITRDPIYADALADNPRFKVLSARLEAQMAATKLP
jgi:predicted Zn-dependent protease